MKAIILFITLSIVPINVLASETMTMEEGNNFAKVIRMKDYVCDSFSKGYFMGKQHKGMVFRIICNDDSLTYRITVTPSSKFIVEPWKY